MITKYKKIQLDWVFNRREVTRKASREISEMLEAMGVAPGEYYELQSCSEERGGRIISVKYKGKGEKAHIGCIYESDYPAPSERSPYDLEEDVFTLVIAHGRIRQDYCKRNQNRC